MMGLVVGDALGVPVQFLERNEILNRPEGPVTGMESGGVFDMPAGTWSDDSSMALATLASITAKGTADPGDIMLQFVKWLLKGEYTPFGEPFDEGNTCVKAISNFVKTQDVTTCGVRGEYANGNGALMRILPACLYYYEQQKRKGLSDDEAIDGIHMIAGLTHNHLRSNMCCGTYFFCVRSIAKSYRQSDRRSLGELLAEGIACARKYYGSNIVNLTEMAYLGRLFALDELAAEPAEKIKSSGYVIDSIEAAVWCLCTTASFRDCLLKAVNLGKDTDTVAAIAGGLAGLYYGYESIPQEWLEVIKRRNWIERLCEDGESRLAGTANSAKAVFATNDRSELNREIFEDTLAMIDENPELICSINRSVNEQKLYPEGSEPELSAPIGADGRVVVSGKRSFEAAQPYARAGKRVCVLNFASATHPGGGVKNGSSAQEESLCRCSTLYPCLNTEAMLNGFYRPHIKMGNSLHNDDCIFTPGVVVIKSDTDYPKRLDEAEWYKADLITCAAPNLRGSKDLSDEELYELLLRRAEKIFRVAAANGAEVLILGAFGCGAFRNPPECVAQAFKTVGEKYLRYFETVEYAVFCAGREIKNFKIFEDIMENF